MSFFIKLIFGISIIIFSFSVIYLFRFFFKEDDSGYLDFNSIDLETKRKIQSKK